MCLALIARFMEVLVLTLISPALQAFTPIMPHRHWIGGADTIVAVFQRRNQNLRMTYPRSSNRKQRHKFYS